ncbi:MAG: ABC transporter ATP-binding protein [Acidobacteriota bacterium]
MSAIGSGVFDLNCYAVETFQLHKTYIRRRSLRDLVTHPFKAAEIVEALKDVNLHIEKGEIFGFLGPNGAGKTSLLKILSCLVLPTRGRATVNGVDIRKEKKVKSSIGLVTSDERSFYWRLSGIENLRFFARLYDIAGGNIKSRINELIERMDLGKVAARPFMSYSSGMKQRLSIARALLHNPPILFLDEPTRSLDPQSAINLREFVKKELNGREGKTILLATHNLREAEVLCNRIAIMSEGMVKEIGSVERIRRIGLKGRLFALEVHNLPPEVRGNYRIIREAKTSNGNILIEVSFEGNGELSSLLETIIGKGGKVISCDRIEPDLEEAFSRILRGN